MRGPSRVVLCVTCIFFALAAGAQVTMPLAEYEALRGRANPDAEPNPKPPAPFAFETADLVISMDGESARIVQTLGLTLFADGWQKVPLGEAGSFIAAKFGGLDGRVNVAEDGWSLQVQGRGRHQVILESVVPVRRDETSTRPTWQLGLHLPPAAVVRGRIEVPDTVEMMVEEVELEGAGLVQRGEGSWSFVAAPTPEPVGFTLRGRRTLPERAQLPLRFETTSATAAVLSRTRLEVHGWIEARVAQGRLPELRVPLPTGFEVVSVQGPIAGWNVAGGRLVVTPLEPVESSLAIRIGLSAQPVQEFVSPLLVPADSHRTLLLTKAALRGDGLLELTDPGAVRAPAESETTGLSEDVRGAPGGLVAVLDPARPPRWRAEWADRTEVLAAQVDRLLVDVLVGESGRAAYQLWAEVRNRGAQQLVVTPPPGFELVAGHRDGEPVSPGAAGAGLAVPLSSGEGSQVIHLAGLLPVQLPKGKGDLSLPLPALSAPAARVEVRLVLPGGREYELAEASRAGSIGTPPGHAARSERRVQILNSNMIAKQVLSLPDMKAASSSLFPMPPGFCQLQAVWSALSPTPGPLAVRIENDKENLEWF
ncbi:MAG TPA: hypothetical protein VF179_06435 [Thermoanaerobaculia bacterium]|nr:hypothetical protein [Thermoanaerobaculia bacterium]